MEVLNRKATQPKGEKFLSKRELLTLEGLINGKRNKEIAKTMGINEKTVSTYRTRVNLKLRVPKGSSSLVIAMYAVARGYLHTSFFDVMMIQTQNNIIKADKVLNKKRK